MRNRVSGMTIVTLANDPHGLAFLNCTSADTAASSRLDLSGTAPKFILPPQSRVLTGKASWHFVLLTGSPAASGRAERQRQQPTSETRSRRP